MSRLVRQVAQHGGVRIIFSHRNLGLARFQEMSAKKLTKVNSAAQYSC